MGERAHKDRGNNFFRVREVSGIVETYTGGTGLYEKKKVIKMLALKI